jgi:hypothetical protein
LHAAVSTSLSTATLATATVTATVATVATGGRRALALPLDWTILTSKACEVRREVFTPLVEVWALKPVTQATL